jgi:threonine-phosphate decarboxylase
MLNRQHGGDLWRYAGTKAGKIIDFSANINPLGPPKCLPGTIRKNIKMLIHYPEPQTKTLKESLAQHHCLSNQNIIVGNGSIELVYLIFRAFKAKLVLIPAPTFSEYEFAAKAEGTSCLFFKTQEKDNFKVDIAGFIKLIPKADLIFLCNPNNPTGTLILPQEILVILDTCKKHKKILVVDEAFADFLGSSDKSSLAALVSKNKHLMILRSLTKFFALPGLRLGYALGHKETIKKISQFKYPWNVNSLAQIAGVEILKDKSYAVKTKNFIKKEKLYLFNNLRAIEGIKVYPSEVNFILGKLTGSKILKAQDLSKKLLERGILIRNCDNFRGLSNRFFRVAVKKREENNRLLSNLKVLLQ